ncbi:MAG: ThuA domain-containing protein [Balneolaceae bacterium]
MKRKLFVNDLSENQSTRSLMHTILSVSGGILLTILFTVVSVQPSAAEHSCLSRCFSNNGAALSALDGSDGTDVQTDTLHIHMISGSAEYESERSLRRLTEILKEELAPVQVTASWGEDAGSHLPEIEQLAGADLLLIFTRRMTLPDEQLSHIIRHVEAEKPVIGIRTASHAFEGFPELDAQVFGGDYDGHGDDEPVQLQLAEGAAAHPVMEGIQPWNRSGKIYRNPELGPNAVVLLYGEGQESGIREPVAWTNRYGESGRAFYTSMGLVEDFDNDSFIRLLLNAVKWLSGEGVQSR